jgi:tripartite-type tricarboxylate transporter receptor subunit TctC
LRDHLWIRFRQRFRLGDGLFHFQCAIVILNAEMPKVLALPTVKAVLAEQGFDADPGSPEEMSRRIADDVVNLRKVAETVGIGAK